MKEYALYKGEECLAIGTIKEIAEKLKIKEDTVKFYGMKSYKERTTEKNRRLIVLESEEEDEML